MKKLLLGATVIAVIGLNFSQTAHAQVGQAMSLFKTQLIAMITQKVTPDKMCRKAKIIKGVLSLRSAGGIACGDRFVAAFAEIVCPHASDDGYEKSQCHGKAMAVLSDPGTEGKEKVTGAHNVMIHEVNKLPPSLKNSFCAKAHQYSNDLNIPDLKEVLNEACSESALAAVTTSAQKNSLSTPSSSSSTNSSFTPPKGTLDPSAQQAHQNMIDELKAKLAERDKHE